MDHPVTIIGGGLAGCEAAWQLLRRGHKVNLYEMRPQKFSPAHQTEKLAELVCSNSFKSNTLDNASGLLKEEMRRLDSLIIHVADKTSVAAGSALAVDRLQFSMEVEGQLRQQKDFTLHRMEMTKIPRDTPVIIATGPLTSDALATEISGLINRSYLYFYDAIAPIVEADSINMEKVFWASRYNKGTPDYLNCPFTAEEYKHFWQELFTGKKVAPKVFEEIKYFESCLPVEVLACRGEKSLVFGPLRPVGLINPRTGTLPYAVVQLRKENTAGTLLNMVGFQTKLTWPEQRRIFRLIPGLEKAEFARYGSIHRNTYIHSPLLLHPSLQLKNNENIFFAGQITGVEGYIESAAMGLWAGINAALKIEGKKIQPPPAKTAIGALLGHITSAENADHFQPMNMNFGLLLNLSSTKIPKKERNTRLANQALEYLANWISRENIL